MVKWSSSELFLKRTFFFKVRGREGERGGAKYWCERETSIGLPFVRAPAGWAQTCSLGVGPDQEPNLQSFGWQDGTQPTEPRRPGHQVSILTLVLSRTKARNQNPLLMPCLDQLCLSCKLFFLCSRGFCCGKAQGSLCQAITPTTRPPDPGRSCGRKWGQAAKLWFPCPNASWNGGIQAKAFLPWEISSQQELWYSVFRPETHEWPQLEPTPREWRARAPSNRSHWCYFFGGCTSFIIFIPE